MELFPTQRESNAESVSMSWRYHHILSRSRLTWWRQSYRCVSPVSWGWSPSLQSASTVCLTRWVWTIMTSWLYGAGQYRLLNCRHHKQSPVCRPYIIRTSSSYQHDQFQPISCAGLSAIVTSSSLRWPLWYKGVVTRIWNLCGFEVILSPSYLHVMGFYILAK